MTELWLFIYSAVLGCDTCLGIDAGDTWQRELGQQTRNSVPLASSLARDPSIDFRSDMYVPHPKSNDDGSTRSMMRRESAKIASNMGTSSSHKLSLGHTGPLEKPFLMSDGKSPQDHRHDQTIPEVFVHKHLQDFQAGSLNSEKYPELQIIGAGLLPKQILEIMTYHTSTRAVPSTVVAGFHDVAKHAQSSDASLKRLESLLTKYGSDKAHHGYHAFYASILDALAENIKGHVATLEVGLGTNNSKLVSSMGADGRPGASNRAFRDYLPEDSRIYGADVDREILYREERISTAYVNQLEMGSFETMTKQMGQNAFDLIVDDGLHALPANLNVLLFGLKHVRPGGWVVVEDIEPRHFTFWTKFVDAILGSNQSYRTSYYRFKKTDCYLVHKVS